MDVGFTAMKASWLSKLDPRKANGSMVLWLKSKAAADWLLQTGQLCMEEGLMAPSVRDIFRTPEAGRSQIDQGVL